jgi:hypothetical protein
MVVDNALYRAFLLKVPDCNPRKTAIDLEPLDEDTLGDESEGWHFLENTIICGFIKGDGVLRLVLDLPLRPLLLLCGFTAG